MVSYSCRRRFADSHQGVFDGEDGLFIVREGLRVQVFGKPLNVPDRPGHDVCRIQREGTRDEVGRAPRVTTSVVMPDSSILRKSGDRGAACSLP
jgi:hypothetical protein